MKTEQQIPGKYCVFKTWRYKHKKRMIAVNLTRESAMKIVQDDIKKGGDPKKETMIVFDKQL